MNEKKIHVNTYYKKNYRHDKYEDFNSIDHISIEDINYNRIEKGNMAQKNIKRLIQKLRTHHKKRIDLLPIKIKNTFNKFKSILSIISDTEAYSHIYDIILDIFDINYNYKKDTIGYWFTSCKNEIIDICHPSCINSMRNPNIITLPECKIISLMLKYDNGEFYFVELIEKYNSIEDIHKESNINKYSKYSKIGKTNKCNIYTNYSSYNDFPGFTYKEKYYLSRSPKAKSNPGLGLEKIIIYGKHKSSNYNESNLHIENSNYKEIFRGSIEDIKLRKDIKIENNIWYLYLSERG